MTGSRPLAGRRVIVTRPAPRGDTLAEALRRVGAHPVELPLLRIEPIPGCKPLSRDLGEYDYVIFTSANAVSCFVAQLTGSSLAQLREHRGIAVIGPATQRELEAHNAAAAVIAPDHVAEGLASRLGMVAGKTFLWPRAEAVRPVLSGSLRAGGAAVTEVVVYRTVASVPSDAADAVAYADAVTFTSPSGVRAWHSALGKPAMRVVCIGPVTARAALEMGFHVDGVARPHTVDGIMSALSRVLDPYPRSAS